MCGGITTTGFLYLAIDSFRWKAICQSFEQDSINRIFDESENHSKNRDHNQRISIWSKLYEFLKPDIFWFLFSIPVSIKKWLIPFLPFFSPVVRFDVGVL